MIFVIILHLPLFLEFVQSAQLVQRPNGYFITGRGCGTTTALKYLNYLPKTLEEHQCSFINLNRMVPIKGSIHLKNYQKIQLRIHELQFWILV